MNKTSIIRLSYNTEDYTRLCIESIRNFTPRGSYELIVIDNASRDGSLAYLRAQKDLRLVENAENRGFPAACNQGMALAMPRNDLLLLNSDTIVTPHWLENLQAALHSAENIGAAGCVTNSCSHFQQIPVSYADLDEMLAFAEQMKGRLVLSLRNRNDTSYERELPKVDFEKIQGEIEELNLKRQNLKLTNR